MRHAAVDIVTPSQPPGSLPIGLDQRASLLSALATLAIAVPALAGLAAVGAGIATAASAGPMVAAPAGVNALALTLIALGLAIWAALFGIPLSRSLAALGARRSVVIDHHAVAVSDRGLLARRTWREPLAAYSGIVHHVRTSVSGARHELVLVHRSAGRSVLLAVGERIGKDEIERMCALLALPELPASALYVKPSPPRAPAGNGSAPAPVLAAA
ncbi:MAG: hypothetical protein NW205_04015 [Hyphomicrobiaceae bacterium]|nr:hypothetical protein [Hyphomicrobiaceae bacterium]